MHSDFPGGSIEVEGIEQATRTLRLMPALQAQRGWPAWWYARLEGLPVGEKITFSIRANTKAFVATRILAAEWAQPTRAVVSADDATWTRTEPGQTAELVRTYVFTATASRMWIAWGPPFVASHAEALIDRVVAAVPGAERFTLAKTRGGREVSGVRVGTGKEAVWVQARQHAWEAGSSWVARGFIEWVAGAAPEAVALRARATVHFIPIVDVDNVTLGAGGKDAVPQDQNRDWTAQPHYPEVAAAQQRLRELDTAGALRLYLDLHNPGAKDLRPFFFGLFPEQLDSPLRGENYARWLRHAAAQMSGPLVLEPKYRVADYQKKAGEHLLTSRTWTWANTHERVVATTLETPWNTPHSTADGYQTLGRQLAAAVAAYLAEPAGGK